LSVSRRFLPPARVGQAFAGIVVGLALVFAVAAGAAATARAEVGTARAAVTARAAMAAPDPAVNLEIGALPYACYGAPLSSACEVPIIGYLDAAREALGFGPYALPADFPSLAPERQLFILVDLDRRAYSLPLISGLSPQLDAAAAAGASVEQDPAAPSADRAVWASAWAAGLTNVLAAYYQWMYADGWPGLNIDCQSPGAPGCWVHRHGILFAFAPTVRLTMGAAAATDGSGRPVVGMLIAATRKATGPSEDYTWAEAEADGAGRAPGAAVGVAGLVVPRITDSTTGSPAGSAEIRFSGAPAAARFQCALVAAATAAAAAPRYAACRSPARYAGLRPGTYDFFVRTDTSAARHSAPAERRLRVS
jgi:hypothetical protein